MSNNLTLRWIFAISLLMAVVSGAWIFWQSPTILSVAVGPANSPLAIYAGEIDSALAEANASFRLKVILTQGSSASSQALEEKKVDLAIVRSDDETAKTARSLVVVQRKTFFIVAGSPNSGSASNASELRKPAKGTGNIATNSSATDSKSVAAEGSRRAPGQKVVPAASKETETAAQEVSFLDLFGKSRGALLKRAGAWDRPAIIEVLNHYGREADAQSLRELDIGQAEAEFKSKRLDFLIVLAHPSEASIRSLVKSLRQTLGKTFRLLGLPGSKGLAYQLKHLEVSTLPAGVFGGSPPLPAADLESVAVTYELVATARLSERNAALLTKTLTDLRTLLRGSDDGEFSIELPGADEPRRYLPHAGTVAQINRESKTFLETYSDLIWLGLFAVGSIGSVFTALMRWLGVGRRSGPTS